MNLMAALYSVILCLLQRDYGEYMNITEKALKELGMFRKLEPFHEAQYIKDLRFFIEFEILHHLTVRHNFFVIILCKYGAFRKTILNKEQVKRHIKWVTLCMGVLNAVFETEYVYI